MSMGFRQQPGLACERCRAKKSRCDRQQPECGGCAEAGAVCIFNDKRPQRGPKKGQLKALRSRIADLERRLVEELDQCPETEALPPAFDDGLHSPLSLDNGVLPRAAPAPVHVSPHDVGLATVGERDLDVVEPGSGSASRSMSLSGPSSVGGGGSAFGIVSPAHLSSADAASAPTLAPRNINENGDGDNVDAFLPNPCPPSPRLSTVPSSGHGPPARQSMIGGPDSLDLVQADLDQLFFDRVHPIAPIVHRFRHLSQRRRPGASEARACLQSAMRTLAAAMSAPFRALGNALYADTRQMLERLESREHHASLAGFSLPEMQAWLLLALYEFMQKPQRLAVLTAGRAFRMLQMSRLHQVDSPTMGLTDFNASPDAWIEAEEKRRTFWLAYCLDRFANLHGDWPLMLHEDDDIRVRLPAPEADFENNRPVHTELLSEAINGGGQGQLSPFAECVLLASIWGRCASHRRRSLADAVYGRESREFWSRHEWLDSFLEKQTRKLSQTSPAGATLTDPILVFDHMLAHAAVLGLRDTMQAIPWPSGEHQLLLISYEQRALQAAREIVTLSRAVVQLSCFKAHPFSHSVLFYGARFLLSQAGNVSDFQSPETSPTEGVEELLDTLRGLEHVNVMAKEVLLTLKVNDPRGTSQTYDWVLSCLNE